WFYLKRLCHGDVIILGGHAGLVTSVAYSPDEKVLASGSDDGTVRFWDAHTHQELCTFQEPASVKSVVFNREGNRFATVCENKCVNVRDLTDPEKPWRTLPGAFTFAVFSPNGKWLVTGGQLTKLKVWDLETLQPAPHFQPDVEAQCGAFSLDGQTLATGGWGEEAVRIWNVADGQKGDRPPRPVGNPVNSLAFSPDGKFLATGGERPSTSTEGAVSVWNPKTGEELHLAGGYFGRCITLAFSPQANYLAATFLDGTVTVWDKESGKVLFSARRQKDLIPSIAFSPDRGSEYLAFAMGSAVVVERWKGSTGREGRS